MQLLRRLAAFFGMPIRIPGWGAMLVGAYTFIPDTAARLDFWTGKVGPLISPYLASPWTGVALVVTGAAWLWHFRGVVHVHHHSATVQLQGVGARAEAGSLVGEVLRADSRVPLQDAMMYGLNRVWPKPGDKVKDGQDGALLLFFERARGLAREGRLVVFGKLSKGHLPAAIPAHFWETNQFDYMSVVFQEPEEAKTEPATLPAGREVYHDLRVDKFQVERLWPRC